MNRNLFKYSLRFVAVLMTAAMFVSCEKDEFTEADALELELQKLRAQDAIDVAKADAARKHELNLLDYQKQVDQLACHGCCRSCVLHSCSGRRLKCRFRHRRTH